MTGIEEQYIDDAQHIGLSNLPTVGIGRKVRSTERREVMGEDTICPIMTVACSGSDSVPCLQERCELWVDGRCAIYRIGWAMLHNINAEIKINGR